MVVQKKKRTKFDREVDLVMAALTQGSRIDPDLGNKIKKASQKEEQKRKEELYPYKSMANSLATAAELGTGAYIIGKGLRGLNMLNKSKLLHNNITDKLYASDKAQIAANSLGAVTDAYQLITADNTRDKIENSIELPADVAGIIGGTNWFKNTPMFTKHGKYIDNALDFAGYTAAGYDVVAKPINYLIKSLIDNLPDTEKKE